MILPKILIIHWKDACSEEAEGPHKVPVSDSPLVKLTSIGWRINESDEAISIAMELEEDGSPSRFRMHIPKANIIEMRELDAPAPRSSRRRKHAT